MNKNIKNFHEDNKGSALLLVVISISFIAILATVLLASSYMNLRLKTMDTQARVRFYSAETAMAEIQGALEEYSAASMKNAYEVQIEQFIDTDSSTRNTLMKTTYFTGLVSMLENPAKPGKYDAATLQKFTTSPNVTVVDYSDEPGSKGAIVLDLPNERLTLKNVRVEYVDKGISSNITTDIVLGLPSSKTDVVGYLKYIFISDELLSVDDGNICLAEGGIYAGDKRDPAKSSGIQVVNNSNLSVGGTGSPVISRSDIKLYDGSELDITNGDIWTKNIILDSTLPHKASYKTGGDFESDTTAGSKVDINGDTHVKGDLYLNARNSDATFRNKYYGYGSGAGAMGDSSANSAILLNGYGSSLDMSGVNELLVGGHSYVSGSNGHTYRDTVGSDSAFDVMEGESIAAKKNETIYLVNSKYLVSQVGSNPASEAKAISIITSGSISGNISYVNNLIKKNAAGTAFIDEFQEIYDAYLNPTEPLKCFHTQDPQIVYFYYNFKDEASAHEYVKKYYVDGLYGGDRDKFNSNLDLFLKNNKIRLNAAGARYEVVGAAIANFGGGGGYSFMNAQTYNPTLSVEVSKLDDDYLSLQTFLRKYEGADTAKFDMGYVNSTVNVANIRADSTTQPYSYGGTSEDYKMVVLGGTATEGAVYLIDNEGDSPFKLREGARNGLYVCTGDVEVYANSAVPFHGLVMSLGKIEVKGSGTGQYMADETLLRNLFSYIGKDELDKYFNEYPDDVDVTINYKNYIGFENWIKDTDRN